MSKSDDLEDEIRGLFNKSIEQIPVKDEVEHASHIANRQRGFWDVAAMICIGAMAIFTALLSPKTPISAHNPERNTQGDTSDE